LSIAIPYFLAICRLKESKPTRFLMFAFSNSEPICCCKFLSMDKVFVQQLLDRVRSDYNKIAEDFSRKRSTPPKIAEGKFSADSVVAGEKILDLGCGNGRLFELLENKGIDYFGIDNSEGLIEKANKKYPIARFQVADALNLPFLENYFDKIYCLAVLHHIPSKEKRLRFLQEAERVLKPSGSLILTNWHFWKESKFLKAILKYGFLKAIGQSQLDFKDIFLPWKDSQGKVLAERYYHGFTRGELKSLVKKTNLKIKECGLWRYPAGHSNIYIIAEKPVKSV